MIWPAPVVPYFHSDGRFFKAIMGRSGRFSHWFGHARDIEIRGPSVARLQVHLIADLDLADPRLAVSVPGLRRLPLLHPFRHEGGSLKYRVLSDEAVEVLEVMGDLTEGWPYENYPERFERLPFDLTEPEPCSREEFDEPMYQGVRREHFGRFISVIPDSTDYKQGLWQPDGNVLVNAVFAFQRTTRVVETYNECD